MNDDVFDFFYEALPGYEEVGRRRILLGCWGAFNNPDHVDYDYKNMDDWGNEMFVTPGIVVDGELVTTNLVDINLGIRILLGSSLLRGLGRARRRSSPKDPLGNPVDKRHPWNQTTIPKPQKRDLDGGNYSWVMSPRWYDKRTGDHLALDTGGGALARLWATALANKVHTPFVNATGHERADHAAEDAGHARDGPRVEDPAVVQRDRARPRADLLRRLRRRHGAPLPRQGARGGPRRATRRCSRTSTSRRGDRLRLPRGGARRALAPPGDPRRQDRQLPPVPADAVERQPDATPTARPGPYEDAVHGQPIFEENGAGRLPRHRHHARGAQLRPVPAVRRAHVPRQRQDDQAGALADVRRSTADGRSRRERSRRCSSRSRRFPTRSARDRDRARAGAARPVRRGAARGSSRAGRRRAASRTSWSRTCCCCTGCTRCRSRSGCAGALDEVRPYLVSHGGDVELLGVDGRRRAAAAARALQRLPVLGDDAEARDRGGDPQRRAGRRADRGRGRRRRRPALLQIEIACPVPQAG